jgi:hypothetical protein
MNGQFKSLNKILLNVENGFVNCRDIKLFSIENHTHEERVIDVNLVVQDFLKTIEVPDNANITNKLPVLREMILD